MLKLFNLVTLLVGIVVGVAIGHYWLPSGKPIPVPSQVVAVPTPVVGPTSKVIEVPACIDRTYVVIRGNSLWRIAEHEYGGRGYLYQLIAEVNDIKSPYVIHVGQVLRIPMTLCNLSTVLVKESKVARTGKKTATKKIPSTEKMLTQEEPEVLIVHATPPARLGGTVTFRPKTAETSVVQEAPVSTPTPRFVEESKPLPAVVPQNLPLTTSEERKFQTRGNFWNFYDITPKDNGNKIDTFHVDAGIVASRFRGGEVLYYTALNAMQDAKGRPQNNRVEIETGLKFVKSFTHGEIEFAGAVALESRREGLGSKGFGKSKLGVVAFSTGQFFWQQKTPSSESGTFTAPGFVEWNAGYISPYERGNLIGAIHLEQGLTMMQIRKVLVSPTGWIVTSADSKGYPWNNRNTFGTGLSFAYPWQSGVLNLKLGYECVNEHNSKSSPTSCGPTVKLDLRTMFGKKK